MLHLAMILSLSLLPVSGFSAESSESEKSESKSEEKSNKDDNKKIKDYDEVITEEAVTQSGLFRVHQLDDKIFL